MITKRENQGAGTLYQDRPGTLTVPGVSAGSISRLEVQEIVDLRELEELTPEWNALLERIDRPTIYLTPEWMMSWWKRLGGYGRQLCALVMRDGGKPVAIALLMEIKQRFFGLPVRRIEMVSMTDYADSPSNCSGSLDIIARDRHGEVVDAILSHFTRVRKNWDFIHLNPIPSVSSTILSLAMAAQLYGCGFRHHTVYADSIVPVETSWAQYEARLPKRFRRNLRSQEARLRKLGNVTYRELRSPEEIEQALPAILGIEKRSWKWNGGVSINSAAFGDFYNVFALEAARKGWLRLWIMEVNGEQIAYNYSVEYRGTVTFLKTGYVKEYKPYSPGHLLTFHEFQRLFQDGVKRINLQWGDISQKRRWRTTESFFSEVFIANRTFNSKFLMFLHFGLSLYGLRRTLLGYRDRVARKLHLHPATSPLTRTDQLGPGSRHEVNASRPQQVRQAAGGLSEPLIGDSITVADTTVPVVVLKLYHHLSLGVVRSLGRLGIEVLGIDQNPRAPGLHSQYCRGRYVWDIDGARPDKTIEFLLRIGKSIGKRSVLINTADEGALLLAEHAEALREWFILPYVLPELVRSLTSKKEMYYLARKQGIDTAEAVFPQSRDDVEKFLQNAQFPVMLKGIDGERLDRRIGRKMVIARSAKDLLERYEQMEDPKSPNLMLQEYIPGGDDCVWMFNGYFNENSDCLFAMTGKKIRQAPVYTGYTSLGICLANETVEQTTITFMKKIGYRGILDIGYRFDARDGKYKVLDINPRIGATFRLFVATNGMDVARAAYLDLTGQPVPRSEPNEGRKWFVEERDIVSSVRYYRDKKLTLRQWIASFEGVQESAWFALDDLLPFFIMCGQFIHKMFSRPFRLPLDGRREPALRWRRAETPRRDESVHAG
ncbi:MAG: GNAT family N-acetyltransferase [Ignavibacteria bacterium]|nr:MAG: GNAT family N-acetyltransferase [Ignavibacteria bacterium]